MRRSLSLLVLLAVLAPAASASARSTEDYTYTYDQLWRAAVRLIAVDFRFPISDRDPEIGYVLFSYRDAGREHNGSLELARTTGVNGTPQVRVTMQVPSMPGYVERMLLDRLSRKLTEDYGRPPPTRRPEPPAPPVADDDEDDDDAADTDAPSED
ncbi:MAG: hypothetical protein H6719_02315 [Sandaracinaceae bacterium]|nr:hypothetical protein [Sandaracinaceae bacterium]